MNNKKEYQKPVITLIELECETMIAGSNGLTNDSDKNLPGLTSNSLNNSIKINLSDEE